MIRYLRHELSPSLALLCYVLAAVLLVCSGRNRNGGEIVKPGALPFMAAIENSTDGKTDWRLVCQGAIISSHHILTAGSCVNHRNEATNKSLYRVKLGCNHPESCNTTYEIVKFFVGLSHRPKFFGGIPRNDIVLVTVEPEIKFNAEAGERSITWIGLADLREDDEWGTLKVAGWGPNPRKPQLRTIEVKADRFELCYNAFGDQTGYNQGPFVMCAKKVHPSSDPCNGYTGGPLFKTLESGIDVLVGVVPGLCPGSELNVYSRVSSHRPWLHNCTGGGICDYLNHKNFTDLVLINTYRPRISKVTLIRV